MKYIGAAISNDTTAVIVLMVNVFIIFTTVKVVIVAVFVIKLVNFTCSVVSDIKYFVKTLAIISLHTMYIQCSYMIIIIYQAWLKLVTYMIVDMSLYN